MGDNHKQPTTEKTTKTSMWHFSNLYTTESLPRHLSLPQLQPHHYLEARVSMEKLDSIFTTSELYPEVHSPRTKLSPEVSVNLKSALLNQTDVGRHRNAQQKGSDRLAPYRLPGGRKSYEEGLRTGMGEQRYSGLTNSTTEIEIKPSSIFEVSPLAEVPEMRFKPFSGPYLLAQANRPKKKLPCSTWQHFTDIFDKAESNYRSQLKRRQRLRNTNHKCHTVVLTDPDVSVVFSPVEDEDRFAYRKMNRRMLKVKSLKAANKQRNEHVRKLKEEISRMEEMKKSDSEADLQMKCLKSMTKPMLTKQKAYLKA